MWFVVCFHPFPHHMQHGLPHTSALRLAHFACPFSANLQQAGPHNSETNIFRWSKSNGKGSLQPIDWWISCLPSDSTLHRSKQFGKTSWRSHGSYLSFGSILSVPKRRASKFQHHKKTISDLKLRCVSHLQWARPPSLSSTSSSSSALVMGLFFARQGLVVHSPGPIHPLGVVGWSTLLFWYWKFHHRFITSFSASNLSQVWRSITDTHRMPAFLWGIHIHVSQASAHLHNFQVWNASTIDPAEYFYRQSRKACPISPKT